VRVQKSDPEYTLQQLAAAAGMTVRNVRAYQTRGLIPAPTRQGRRSVYGPKHLARLEEIRQARARGATLSLIRAHLSQGGALDSHGVNSAWLPLRTASAGRRGPTAADRETSLTRILSRVDSDGVSDKIQGLVDAGVLRLAGGRVVADQALAGTVSGLVRRGVPVAQAFDVALAAAAAGRALREALATALGGAATDQRVQRDALDLVARVLSTVVIIDLTAVEDAAPSP